MGTASLQPMLALSKALPAFLYCMLYTARIKWQERHHDSLPLHKHGSLGAVLATQLQSLCLRIPQVHSPRGPGRQVSRPLRGRREPPSGGQTRPVDRSSLRTVCCKYLQACLKIKPRPHRLTCWHMVYCTIHDNDCVYDYLRHTLQLWNAAVYKL